MAPTSASITKKPVSNISAAFAKQSPLDIPNKSRSAGRLGSSSHNHNQDHDQAQSPKADANLLTPPQSLSPSLPPRKARGNATHADSDIDLQDAVDHAATVGQTLPLSSAALSGIDAADGINATMLAQDHLPDFLLASGPLAIRHILGHLTQALPGFARIPPAKARRLVVAALESRSGPVPTGEVLFEKVGWGRWDARIEGQAPRAGRSTAYMQDMATSPPPSVSGSYAFSSSSALQIPNAGHRGSRPDIYSGGSWTGDSFASAHDEDMMDMAEHEADKMSLDERDDVDEDEPIAYQKGDTTDEEDWAGMGPQALLKQYSGTTRGPRVNYNHLSTSATHRRPSTSLMASGPSQQRRASSHAVRRAPTQDGPRLPGGIMPLSYYSSGFLGPRPSPIGRTISASIPNTRATSHHRSVANVSSQEREAVEALLRMGSV